MDNYDSALMFLGICRKAGKLAIGTENCGIETRAGKAKLLIAARDASENTGTRVLSYAERSGTPLLTAPYSSEELGRAVGKTTAAALAITDIGLAASFAQRIEELYPGSYTNERDALAEALKRAERRKMEKKRHKENKKRGNR